MWSVEVSTVLVWHRIGHNSELVSEVNFVFSNHLHSFHKSIYFSNYLYTFNKWKPFSLTTCTRSTGGNCFLKLYLLVRAVYIYMWRLFPQINCIHFTHGGCFLKTICSRLRTEGCFLKPFVRVFLLQLEAVFSNYLYSFRKWRLLLVLQLDAILYNYL